jgi:glycerol dehydrogenase
LRELDPCATGSLRIFDNLLRKGHLQSKRSPMINIFLSPRQYIQKEGVINEVGPLCLPFGRRPMVLGDSLVSEIIRPKVEVLFREVGLAPLFVVFAEECSRREILRLKEIIVSQKLDFVVGTGGGKCIDTARIVAGTLGLPFVTIPTSAATCSAASSVAVIYENGVRQETFTGKGPDLALVDSGILSRAPLRLLAAGIGDALGKWYETKPIYDNLKDPDSATKAAMNLSTQIKETVFESGLEASRDVEADKNSTAVEKVLEANILMTAVVSGLGGAKFRIAIAHGFLYGMTVLPCIHEDLHGEVVAFGMLVQLCLEKKEKDFEVLASFLKQLDMPLTLQSLGFTDLDNPLFQEGLRRTCAPGSSVHNMPFPVTEQSLLNAIKEADERMRVFRL